MGAYSEVGAYLVNCILGEEGGKGLYGSGGLNRSFTV